MGDLCTKAGERETRQKSLSLLPKAGELASLFIFLHHILKMKPNKVYQGLDGHSIELSTMGELSLRQPKGGCRLMKMAVY